MDTPPNLEQIISNLINKAKDEKEIAITYENESAHTVEKFDYIFIACGMKNAKKFLHDRNEIEKKISDAV